MKVWGHTDEAVRQAIQTVQGGITIDPSGSADVARDMILEELSTL